MNKITKKIFSILILFFITLDLSAAEEKYCSSLSDCKQKKFYIYSVDEYKYEHTLLKIFVMEQQHKLWVVCHFSINIDDGIYNSASCRNI